MKRNKKYLILGAPDAMSAKICWKMGADFIWASSFVLSSLLGNKDDGMVNIDLYLPLIKGLIDASPAPVILDFDICGRNDKECFTQLNKIKRLKLGGVCIEDESWPKFNAMLKSSSRKLISAEKMSHKLKMAKKILNPKTLIIARTHSLIANEDLLILQKRIYSYIEAGADIICIHYTGNRWNYYKDIINKLDITKPLMVIFSKCNYLVENLDYSKIKYILFPNQIYRMMMNPVFTLKNELHKFDKNSINFSSYKLIETQEIFNSFSKNKK